MRTYLTSFASADFNLSLNDLMRTAHDHGIDELRPWRVELLRKTPFYQAHRSTLDHPRGAGYWLWKPYIILETLEHAASGDIVVYSDAGVTVIRSLAPLFALCAEKGGILLFGGHYDGIGGQQNTCEVWTKRDCFVLMECDTPRYYRAPMLDASFIVFMKNPQSTSLVNEWLNLCRDPRSLTDSPNQLGLRNRPGFMGHRHDQSILSLLAARHGLEIFRSPSQFGNHCKLAAFRTPNEWLRHPYRMDGSYSNSPYSTLLFHHRKRTLFVDPQGHLNVPVCAVRSLGADHNGVQADAVARNGCKLTYVDVLLAIWMSMKPPLRILQIGRDGYRVVERLCAAEVEAQVVVYGAKEESFLSDGSTCINSAFSIRYLECDPQNEQSWGALKGSRFNIVLSNTGSSRSAVINELCLMVRHHLLDETQFALCWNCLDGIEGWAAFRSIRDNSGRIFGAGRVVAKFGLVPDVNGDVEMCRTLGLIACGLWEGGGSVGCNESPRQESDCKQCS